MGLHSEGAETLRHVALLSDPRIVACLAVWLVAILLGIAGLWFVNASDAADRTSTAERAGRSS